MIIINGILNRLGMTDKKRNGLFDNQFNARSV
jgi:hypothetical protein